MYDIENYVSDIANNYLQCLILHCDIVDQV